MSKIEKRWVDLIRKNGPLQFERVYFAMTHNSSISSVTNSPILRQLKYFDYDGDVVLFYLCVFIVAENEQFRA